MNKASSNDASSLSDEKEELRKSVQFAVCLICEEDERENGGGTMTASATQALSELVYLYATTSLARDVDAFANHRKKASKTINVDDVTLVARKNPEILQKLQEFCSSSSSGFEAAAKSRPKKSIPKRNSTLHENLTSSDDDSGCMLEDTDDDCDTRKSARNVSNPAKKKAHHNRDASALGFDSDTSGSSSNSKSPMADDRLQKTPSASRNKARNHGEKSIAIDTDSDMSSTGSRKDKEMLDAETTKRRNDEKVLQMFSTTFSSSESEGEGE